MTGKFFSEFLASLYSKMGVQDRKILLFVDNCPAHPVDVDGLHNVKVIFLLSNTTS